MIKKYNIKIPVGGKVIAIHVDYTSNSHQFVLIAVVCYLIFWIIFSEYSKYLIAIFKLSVCTLVTFQIKMKTHMDVYSCVHVHMYVDIVKMMWTLIIHCLPI